MLTEVHQAITLLTWCFCQHHSGITWANIKASLCWPFVGRIHWSLVASSPKKGPVMRNMFPCHDVITHCLVDWCKKDTTAVHMQWNCISAAPVYLTYNWQLTKFDIYIQRWNFSIQIMILVSLKCSLHLYLALLYPHLLWITLMA